MFLFCSLPAAALSVAIEVDADKHCYRGKEEVIAAAVAVLSDAGNTVTVVT